MRIAFDANGEQLCEGLVVRLKRGKKRRYVVRYIHRNGIVHIVREDRKVGVKLKGDEIIIAGNEEVKDGE